MTTEKSLDQNYWNIRWANNDTGWDIGYPAPAITNYMAQVPDKNIAILIAGCGNAHEAAFLVKNGFTNITLIDIAPEAVKKLQEKFKDFSEVKVLCEDFFEHEGQYDLMIEQTFFCALSPTKRGDYVRKSADLLKEKGKIIGVLFNTTFEKQGPPFGGSVEEYTPLFTPFFDIKTIESCYNSIPPRQNVEVFIILNKKQTSVC